MLPFEPPTPARRHERPIARLLLILLATCRVVGAEEDEAGSAGVVNIDPALLEVEAGGAAHRRGANEEGSLEGGVTILYERIRLLSDSLYFRQTPLVPPAEGQDPSTLFLDLVRILSGPAGPDPEHIHIDTRHTALATINYRGLLRPSRLIIQRQPYDPVGDHGVVRYRIELPDLGDFAGYVLQGRDESGAPVWTPFEAYGNRTELLVEADVAGDRLADPRIRRITLAVPDQVGPGERDHVMVAIYGTDTPGRLICENRIFIEFDEDGHLGDQSAKGYNKYVGFDKDARPDLGFAPIDPPPTESGDAGSTAPEEELDGEDGAGEPGAEDGSTGTGDRPSLDATEDRTGTGDASASPENP